MKMSDETKRALVTCTELVMPKEVQHQAMLDSLSLIQQLETANAELLTKVKQLEAKCHQVERERDAALVDLREAVQKGCWPSCKHSPINSGHKCWKRKYECHGCREDCACRLCKVDGTNDFYEWRGVKEE